jgi:hypothetical protein
MYWNNPIYDIKSNLDSNIIEMAKHNGNHCLFYSDSIDVDCITKYTTLTDICNEVNLAISETGIEKFTTVESNHYNSANLIKINLFVKSLQTVGSVKPMLLQYNGALPFLAGTGGTRLMAAELIPTFKKVTTFISTSTKYRSHFSHLEEVTTWKQFVELCNLKSPSSILVRLTDQKAEYGIDWYEIDIKHYELPEIFIPQLDFCLPAIQNYLNAQEKDFTLTIDWFLKDIDWNYWKNHG